MKIHAPTNSNHFIVIDVQCDCCGQSCKTKTGYEFITMRGKYAGKKLSAHICSKCVADRLFFVNFKKETWDIPQPNL